MSKCDIKKRIDIEDMKQKARYKHTKRISRQTYAKKMCIKQRVWNYMRRNRMFRVKDIVAIIELKEATIRYIICNLEAAGYVIRKTSNTNKKVFFMNATFVFTAKEHILVASIITSKEVTTKEMWLNKQGEYVHKDLVSVDKQIEDEVVNKLVLNALNLQDVMLDFKIRAFEECYSFVDLLRQKYNLERIKSKSGVVSLKSYDGTKVVEIQVAKLISFDQKLILAKEKIDEYLTLKTSGADAEIQTLITRAFDVKNGKVDSKQVLSLKSYPIEHTLWKEANGYS